MLCPHVSGGRHTTHGTKTGATSVPLTELPFGFPGHVFRSPMPFGQYDLHGEVYDRFCEEQIAVISSWRVMKSVSTRPDAICERCTSKRASRCCTCPFLISVCLPKTTWNRQSNRRLPTPKQDTIS